MTKLRNVFSSYLHPVLIYNSYSFNLLYVHYNHVDAISEKYCLRIEQSMLGNSFMSLTTT